MSRNLIFTKIRDHVAETRRKVTKKYCSVSKRVIGEGAGEFRAMPETFQRILTMEKLWLDDPWRSKKFDVNGKSSSMRAQSAPRGFISGNIHLQPEK